MHNTDFPSRRSSLAANTKGNLVIPIKTIYSVKNYSSIKPGSVLLELRNGSLWTAISSEDGILSAFPYSGGLSVIFGKAAVSPTFGLVEDPSELPEIVSLHRRLWP